MAATKVKTVNPVTTARQAAKRAIDPATFAAICALDPSAENRALLLESLAPLFMGAERHNPQTATILARACFGMSGATGEKYATAFTYKNKAGDVVTFDGTPRAVVALTENLRDLPAVLIAGAVAELAHAKASGYSDKVKKAEKALEKARGAAQTETVRKLQTKVSARLVLLSDTIEQCKTWVAESDKPKAVKAVKTAKPAQVTADTLMPA